MAKRRIFCDGRELVLLYNTKNGEESLNLSRSEIASIQFGKYIERKFFFFKVQTEKIEIKPSKKPFSIVYTKSRAKEFFERYKEELASFAKDNRVTFHNNL